MVHLRNTTKIGGIISTCKSNKVLKTWTFVAVRGVPVDIHSTCNKNVKPNKE